MNQDFKEFFELLNSRKIDFLVIGGVAYNFHAPPRATKDIDLWVGRERGNLERLLAAVREFGFPTDELDVADLESAQRVLMLGRVPNRIDILTQPTGLVWEDAWRRRVATDYGGVPVFLLSLEDLITAKRAAGRPRDMADVTVLEEIAESKGRE